MFSMFILFFLYFLLFIQELHIENLAFRHCRLISWYNSKRRILYWTGIWIRVFNFTCWDHWAFQDSISPFDRIFSLMLSLMSQEINSVLSCPMEAHFETLETCSNCCFSNQPAFREPRRLITALLCPLLISIFSKINPFSRITTHLLQIHFYIILPSASPPP